MTEKIDIQHSSRKNHFDYDNGKIRKSLGK